MTVFTRYTSSLGVNERFECIFTENWWVFLMFLLKMRSTDSADAYTCFFTFTKLLWTLPFQHWSWHQSALVERCLEFLGLTWWTSFEKQKSCYSCDWSPKWQKYPKIIVNKRAIYKLRFKDNLSTPCNKSMSHVSQVFNAVESVRLSFNLNTHSILFRL